ncbi:MAG: class III signal peptide-containing protein [Methanobrevibacter sp.]|nr:class III signal peptide-containing protein [Methanobrevibacter sp.]
MMDNSGQTSAEFILLFGGIIVVVLLVIYMYNNYMSDLSGEIASREVQEFNNQLANIGRYFK